MYCDSNSVLRQQLAKFGRFSGFAASHQQREIRGAARRGFDKREFLA